MNLRRSYSTINLTSLLDVVFLTLFLLILTLGDEYRTTSQSLEQREQELAITATVVLAAAEETVSAVQSAAQATSDAIVATNSRSVSMATSQAQAQMVTATSISAHVAQQEEALATSEAQLMTLIETATAMAQQVQAQGTALYATPVAVLASANATLTAVARQDEQRVAAANTQVAQANREVVVAQTTVAAAATQVAQADQDIVEAQSTAVAAIATVTAALSIAAEVQYATEVESTAALVVMATAQGMQEEAQELYQDTQQILAAEVTDPGITIAKARWVDKYATFYVIRLSPYVDGRSTLELFRGGTFLGNRQINSQAQILEFLTALDRSDVADTLVILTFSPDSSDNHRQWILEYLDSYNFKYQRIQEASEQVSE